MFCRTCGKEILDDTVICLNCGCLTGVQPPTGQLNFEQKVDPNSAPNNPNTTQTFPQNMSSEPDEVKQGLVVLSVLFPPAGFILGFIHKDVGKVKSGKMYIKIAVITLIVITLNLIVVSLLN